LVAQHLAPHPVPLRIVLPRHGGHVGGGHDGQLRAFQHIANAGVVVGVAVGQQDGQQGFFQQLDFLA
jgi:hypothetical protein